MRRFMTLVKGMDARGWLITGTLEDGLAADFDSDWELFPVRDATGRRRAARMAGHIVHETSEARS